MYGSDLSDLSDLSEEDLNVNELFDSSSGSEYEGRQYCVCEKPSTAEMITCDDDQCAIIWWHYDCCGLSTETIPIYYWICERCRPGPSLETMDR